MKKVIAILILMFVMLSATVCYAGWVDDWLQQKTVSGPDYLEGQKRGYFTAGSFSARWPQTNDYLASVNMPKFKAGCGGIDGFLGGVSFLNFNYLVTKLQNMLQAAPAIAFDLALQTLSEQASTSLGKFENIIDKLNNVQLDSCKASKTMVVDMLKGVGKKGPGDYEDALADASQGMGLTDLWHSVTAATKSTSDSTTQNLSAVYNGCPADVKQIFATSGSVLDHVGQDVALTDDYTALMRGFIGDITLVEDTGTKLYKPTFVTPCDADVGVENFIDGSAQTKTINPDGTAGSCQNITDQNANLMTWAAGELQGIASDIQNSNGLSDDQVSFLQMTPLPVIQSLKYAIGTGQLDSTIATLADITARGFALVMMRDLYHKAQVAIWEAKSIKTAQGNAKPGSPAYTCKIDLSDPQGDINELQAALDLRIHDLNKSYIRYLKEEATLMDFAKRQQDFYDQTMKDLSKYFNSSLIERAVGQ